MGGAPGVSAWFEAVRSRDLDRVRAVLDADPSLVDRRIADVFAEPWTEAAPGDRRSNTALHWAAVRGGADRGARPVRRAIQTKGFAAGLPPRGAPALTSAESAGHRRHYGAGRRRRVCTLHAGPITCLPTSAG